MIIWNQKQNGRNGIRLRFKLYFTNTKNYFICHLQKVYIHFVWSTKNRFPFLNSLDLRKQVWNHIKENATSKGIFIDFVSGYEDHCHCLISLGIDQTIQKTVMLITGESSFWINKNQLTKEKFEWKDEYFAVIIRRSLFKKNMMSLF